MNYIVYDLEFNQPLSKDNKILDINFEIIQIGALKLNSNLEVTSTFNKLVKPTAHSEIHPYIENLTKITTNMVASNDYFPNVYSDFIDFIGNEDFVLCIWGSGDIKELIKNIHFHNLEPLDSFKKYIDVQKLTSKHINTPRGTRIGLKSAIEIFNMPIEKEFHDAFNDAYYTSEIFKKLYTPEITPSIYTSNNNLHKITKPKQKLDTISLFAQFEKMYNRELSEEEKSLIKLAYYMGKTHQFLK